MKKFDNYIFGIILITAFQILFSFLFQERITLNEGQEWDGQYYMQVAEQFLKNEKITTTEPFGHRVLLPYIASKVSPNNLMAGFFYINLVGLVFQLILLYRLFSIFSKNKVIISVALFVYSFSVYSSYRFAFFAPLSPDYWTINFMTLFIILGYKIQNSKSSLSISLNLTIAIILAILATLLREIFIVVSLGFILIYNPFKIDKNIGLSIYQSSKNLLLKAFLFLPFIASIITYKVLYSFIKPAPIEYTTLGHMWAMFYGKPIDHFFVALFIAFGSCLYLLTLYFKFTFSFLTKNQYIFYLTVSFIILGFLGGTASFRLLYWISPIFYLLSVLIISQMIKEKQIFLLALIILIHIVSQRLYFPILPDYIPNLAYSLPIFTPFDLKPPLLDLYANGDTLIYRIQFFQYLFAGMFILLVKYYRDIIVKNT
jgi:hypothetical protein